jgi:hypothetical protein
MNRRRDLRGERSGPWGKLALTTRSRGAATAALRLLLRPPERGR